MHPRPVASATPRVSVLLPTFNYARFLSEAVSSVLLQDYADYELIIADDCSSDATAEIASAYAAMDARIRFVRHPHNLGMVANWNWCLQAARGTYVKFLFGDDCLIGRDALHHFVRLLEDHPSAVLAASARRIIDARSMPLGEWNDLASGGCWPGRQVLARCLRQGRNLVGEPSAVIFRRAALSRGFDAAFRQVVDLELWCHLLLNGDLAYDATPRCAFRVHPEQQTAVNRPARVGEHELLRVTARYLPQLPAADLPQRERHRALFRILHGTRRMAAQHPGWAEARAELALLLPRRAWWLCWIRHRLRRPFENLARWIRRRLDPAARAAVHESGPPRGESPNLLASLP